MNTKTQDEAVGITELSAHLETEGFDLEAGTTWIYPTNYPCRDYQYAIIQQALLRNTMVSLPTGLGKTFIAAVVMYNFYRWYPRGKVIFMAPTKPLVKQQVDACYNIMAIPKEITAELTGTKGQEFRKDIWNEKRVFFITPQVLQNDLNILQNFGSRVKCLVVDEAHKAKGNHAYCEVIRKLTAQNRHFRVLALSATPGNSLKDVAEVINNLLIAHLEIRTDDSPDVLPYVFERSLETVVVPLGDMLQTVRDNYLHVLERYTKILMQNKILSGNCSMLTKGKVFMTMKQYQEQNRQNRDRNFAENMRYLNICHTLYYAFELLLRHGLRSFLLFFEDRLEKTMLHENALLKNIIRDIEQYMGPLLNIESLPDGTVTGIPETVKFGHPKFYKLRDVTCEHFKQQNNNETRVIIFCEYRETVMEAYGILSLSQPLVRPRIFMGKTSITQKQQINVIKSFRDGSCNTLISTCIGEEGLDVGNVDLIICFDISNKSPIRMIQRMGRTGRKREGRVVVFVTEGREQQTLKECLIQKQNLSNHILHHKSFASEMYKENPRMVPPHIEPRCNKIFITVKNESNQKLSKTKSKNIKDIFKLIAEGKKQANEGENEAKLTDIIDIADKLPDSEHFWNSGKGRLLTKSTLAFNSKLNKVRTLQPVGFIGHSSKTKIMVSLLEKCDSLKFNLPLTQHPILISQKRPEFSTNLKQKDIRSMFGHATHSSVDVLTVDAEVIVIDEDSGTRENTPNIRITTEDKDLNNNCKLCDVLFDCTQYYSTFNLSFNIGDWRAPDTSIFDTINCESLAVYEKALNSCNNETVKDQQLNVTVNDENVEKIDNREIHLVNSPFKPPKTINNVLRMLDLTMPPIPLTQLESAPNNKIDNAKCSIFDCSVNLNGFDDVKFTQLQGPAVKAAEHDLSDGLEFFNISALEDIFEDPHNNAQLISVTPKSDSTIIYTPCLPEVDSPILSGAETVHNQTAGQCTPPTELNDVVDTSLLSPILSGRSKRKLTDETFNQSYSNFPPKTKHDLHELLDNSLIDMLYNQSFEEPPKNDISSKNKDEIDSSIRAVQSVQETKCDQSSINRTDKAGDWENNIWNFCMDSDVESKNEATSNVTQFKEKGNSLLTRDKAVELISDQSDDFIHSSAKSPVLVLSQRVDTRSCQRETPIRTLDRSPSPSFSNHVSPILNKSQANISNKYKINKASKKLVFSDDDDDDFESDPKQSSWIYPKNRNAKSSTGQVATTSRANVKRSKVQDCPFVELEADLSGTQSDITESDADGSFEKSFVDDETQDIANTTMMQVKYLQSVRSADRNRDGRTS
ncbi:uncharacterized protein LOC116181175 isoform X2 [Photinus pyralis]|uniref:uncharacterized protein LOC116181175 isoform X2 n=1 Tax=Photinus pyralis TaxID=7054 RepID=UPI0012670F5C|nr:uncharacterized protein LOC116181175 isoform X2 [Photinus pyralis]